MIHPPCLRVDKNYEKEKAVFLCEGAKPHEHEHKAVMIAIIAMRFPTGWFVVRRGGLGK